MHRTVLLNEAIEGLDLNDKSVVVDATFGGGGHSAEILKRYPKENSSIKIIALDQDASVWKSQSRISFHNENFRNLDKVLEKEGIKEVDGIIFDLGLSSDQLEHSGRGFSFMIDEPLLMQMKHSEKANPSPEDVTAWDVVNTWGEKNLADIIYGYGEERFSRRIAEGIVEARAKKEIKTTFDLSEIIRRSIPARYTKQKLHFATKTFQAIRIAVNDELGALQMGLSKGFEALKGGGRMSVITFHSLEDRIVKRFYKSKEKEGVALIVNKKVILASNSEIKENRRSRSAKLRIIQKI